MRYGFCTDIATTTRGEVEYALLRRIKEAGFDYAEFPLMMIETLSDEAFETLLGELKTLGLACDCTCNYFPSSIKVVGPEADKAQINTYLDRAMGRAKRMGVEKIVFGSCGSRNLPEGMREEEGFRQLIDVIETCVIPACQRYGVTVVMEPIRRQSANFIITLEDGLKVVNAVDAPEIMLLADLMHMSYNDEDPQDIRSVFSSLCHVHLCERDRLLPEDGFSPFLSECLDVLRECGYDDTISFESKDAVSPDGLSRALSQLKAKFAK